MLTQKESDLLTQTGPGTPCGHLMRRYWQPAALSEELPVGGPPVPVHLLGEELVLFRDDQGRPGLLGIHCSHRGADLSYGRIEDGGLRCIYHGWLYDIHGRCLEQPGEPANGNAEFGVRSAESTSPRDPQAAAGGSFREKIRHRAYPCEERAGVIFAYLGPGQPPMFPAYEFLNAPEGHTRTMKLLHECNYLQANEGNYDLSHLTFLHYTAQNRGIGGGTGAGNDGRPGEPHQVISGRGSAPTVEKAEAALTPYGVRSFKVRRDFGPDQYQLYLTEFVLPNLTAFPGPFRGQGGYGVNWHVPIDDTHHWKYSFLFLRNEPSPAWPTQRSTTRDETYRPVRNKENRYLQDRESMKTECYTGLGFDFSMHDLWATESEGPIQDRTNEHLGAMDAAVVAARKVLTRAILDLQEGRESANIARAVTQDRLRIVACNGVFAESKTCMQVAEDLEAEVRY